MNRSDAIERARKLARLATNNSNEHEAALAAAKLRAFCLLNQLSVDELWAQPAYTPPPRPSSRPYTPPPRPSSPPYTPPERDDGPGLKSRIGWVLLSLACLFILVLTTRDTKPVEVLRIAADTVEMVKHDPVDRATEARLKAAYERLTPTQQRDVRAEIERLNKLHPWLNEATYLKFSNGEIVWFPRGTLVSETIGVMDEHIGRRCVALNRLFKAWPTRPTRSDIDAARGGLLVADRHAFLLEAERRMATDGLPPLDSSCAVEIGGPEGPAAPAAKAKGYLNPETGEPRAKALREALREGGTFTVEEERTAKAAAKPALTPAGPGWYRRSCPDQAVVAGPFVYRQDCFRGVGARVQCESVEHRTCDRWDGSSWNAKPVTAAKAKADRTAKAPVGASGWYTYSATAPPPIVYRSTPWPPVYGPSYGLCAENGSCLGDISAGTGLAKDVEIQGYTRRNGTYVRGHYRGPSRK